LPTAAQNASVQMITFPSNEQAMGMRDVTAVFDLAVTIEDDEKPTKMRLTVVFPPEYPIVQWDVSVSRVNHPAVFQDGTLYRIRLPGYGNELMPTSMHDNKSAWSPSYDLAYLIRAIFAKLGGTESSARFGGRFGGRLASPRRRRLGARGSPRSARESIISTSRW
jgi:hypothetical protein